MADFQQRIDEALVCDQQIHRQEVLSWIDRAKDLRTLSKLYRLTQERYYQVQPDLGKEATCKVIQRYLLQCIRENVTDDDEIEGRWEAAQSLHIWFCHLAQRADSSEILQGVANAVTGIFLAGNEDIRNAIEAGFLEHALETEALRPYFEHWSTDSHLKEAWERALKWGKAHPGFTWGLLQQIPKPKA
jgi:hypothetical protein